MTVPPATRPLRIDLHEDDVLFFMHIPKTAGMSLISVLERHFQPHQIMPLHSFPSHEEFREYTIRQRADFRLMRGHFRAGSYSLSHRYVVQNPITITMLRDPVERTISAYRHILRHSNNPMHEELVGKGISLKEYVTSAEYAFHTRDFQTWMVNGGVAGNISPQHIQLSDEARLELTKQRLEQFAWVGLTHRFRESLDLLCYTFGWPPISQMPVENTAPQRSTAASVEPDVLAAITENVCLDLELLKFAEQLFEYRLSQMKQG